jgi:hypothetical protein
MESPESRLLDNFFTGKKHNRKIKIFFFPAKNFPKTRDSRDSRDSKILFAKTNVLFPDSLLFFFKVAVSAWICGDKPQAPDQRRR